jgi:hypothetical protein
MNAETPATPDASELAERLDRLRARLEEFRGRL